MAVLPWGSQALLARFNRMAGRASAGGATDAIPDTAKYDRLADAQNDVILAIAAVAPKGLYGAPTAMTTADGGHTFTYGTDANGEAIYPLGMTSIYTSLDCVPNYPWQPNADYLDEGTQIRIPNNIVWSGPLYWYGIAAPPRMSASVQPTLQPLPARILIAIKAVQSFAEEGARNLALADEMTARWDREWPMIVTTMRRHVRGMRQVRPLTSGGVWGTGSGVGYGWSGGIGW